MKEFMHALYLHIQECEWFVIFVFSHLQRFRHVRHERTADMKAFLKIFCSVLTLSDTCWPLLQSWGCQSVTRVAGLMGTLSLSLLCSLQLLWCTAQRAGGQSVTGKKRSSKWKRWSPRSERRSEKVCLEDECSQICVLLWKCCKKWIWQLSVLCISVFLCLRAKSAFVSEVVLSEMEVRYNSWQICRVVSVTHKTQCLTNDQSHRDILSDHLVCLASWGSVCVCVSKALR